MDANNDKLNKKGKMINLNLRHEEMNWKQLIASIASEEKKYKPVSYRNRILDRTSWILTIESYSGNSERKKVNLLGSYARHIISVG